MKKDPKYLTDKEVENVLKKETPVLQPDMSKFLQKTDWQEYKDLKNRPLWKILTNQNIGDTSTTIAHGLGVIPSFWLPILKEAKPVFQASASDITNIYAQVDTGLATICDIVLAYIPDFKN